MTDIADWSEFTETGFAAHLDALKHEGYAFIRYGEAEAGRQVLWRHDVDFSMHRAASLARIEAAQDVFATYFVNPRAAFYSLAEQAVADLTRGIVALGHEVGLHFDPPIVEGHVWSLAALEAAVVKERSLLESLLNAPVRVMSWHNPTLSNVLDFEADMVGGLLNAYGGSIRRRFTYASDSNGYWRFKPFSEVIGSGLPQLHLLTHPEWWTPDPLAPSARIDRCLEGRARANRRDYDAVLAAAGRTNLRV